MYAALTEGNSEITERGRDALREIYKMAIRASLMR